MDVSLSGIEATNGRDVTVSVTNNTEFQLVGFGGIDDSGELGAAFLVYESSVCAVIPLALSTARSIFGDSIAEVFRLCKGEDESNKEKSSFDEYDDHSSWS